MCFLADFLAVVPSKMNPVGEEGNMFSSLFDKVPAKRAGDDEDIAGVVLYLSSRAGVCFWQLIASLPALWSYMLIGNYRLTWMGSPYVSMADVFSLPMGKSEV